VLVVVREREDYVWQPFIISVAHILVGICAFVWAIKKYRISLFPVPLKRVFEVLWNEKVIFFSVLSINIYQSASTLILGLVQSPEDVAYYYASWRLVIIMHTVVTIPIGMSLFPFIGESFAVSKEAGIQKVQSTTPLIVLITAFMGAVVWLLAPFIITIFYGEAFRPAIGVLRILCFIPMIMGVSNLMGVQTMVNLKLDKLYTIVIALGGFIGIGLNIWLARQYNYIGAAWAWFLTELAIVGLMWVFLHRRNIQIIVPKYFSYRFIAGSIQPMVSAIKDKMSKKKT
jgi:PST family polysaccharide transporter